MADVFEFELLELKEFRREQGHCLVASLPSHVIAGEAPGSARSPLIFLHNGIAVFNGGSSHDDIRLLGGGRYSHWGTELYFSPVDGMPADGKYSVLAPVAIRKAHEGAAPVNHGLLKRSAAEIEEDVRYALRIAENYIKALGGIEHIRHKKIVEFGPGINFGTVAVLLALGAAEVAVADRFLVEFQADYHEPFYRKLGDQYAQMYPGSADVFHRLSHDGKHPKLTEIPNAVEEISGFDGYFDITLSNAVFEHLYDPRNAMKKLYAISAKGAVGFHQIDFRDHRDFSRPLEYLLLSEQEFLSLFESCHGECGNRVRSDQFIAFFNEAGFIVERYESNIESEKRYRDTVIDRLRGQKWNLFARLAAEELVSVSGAVMSKKPH